MSISNQTIIVSGGLNYATSAYNSGPLISIRYFLPILDYRFDPQSHNNVDTSAIALSAGALASDTSPTGEVIYNIDVDSGNSYSLSTTDAWVISAGGETLDDSGDPWLLTDSVVSKHPKINLYNDVPLQNMLSGTSVYASATTNAWEIYDGDRVVGVNTVPAETSAGTSRYFQVTDYYPVSDGNKLKGSFKCRLNKKIGSVKFNKIALYCVQVDANGNETSSPALFAEAMLSSPVIKADYGTSGFDDLIFDVQLELTSPVTNFSNVFYATSGDYWSRTPGGLYYSEKVGIGTFDDSTQAPKAKLHIKDSSIPQFRIDYGVGTSALTSAALSATEDGDLQLMLAANTDFYPSLNNSIDLGRVDNRWDKTVSNQVFTGALSGIQSSISLKSSLIPFTNNVFTFGNNLQRLNNVHTTLLSASDTIRANDIKVITSCNPTINNGANLGSFAETWNKLYVDSIYGDYAGATINLGNHVSPVNDNNIFLGDATHQLSTIYSRKLYLSNNTEVSTGEWLKANRDFESVFNSNDWFLVPNGFSHNTVANKELWNDLKIQNLKYTVIGKTLIMTFTVTFTKSDLATSSRITNLCRIVTRPDSTLDTSILQRLSTDDTYRSFTNVKSYYNGSTNDYIPVFLNVIYTDVAYDGVPGWLLDVQNEAGPTNNNWAGSVFEFKVHLIHEIL